MRKRAFMIMVLVFVLILTGCGAKGGEADSSDNTLIYGSQDYTAINPALY